MDNTKNLGNVDDPICAKKQKRVVEILRTTENQLIIIAYLRK